MRKKVSLAALTGLILCVPVLTAGCGAAPEIMAESETETAKEDAPEEWNEVLVGVKAAADRETEKDTANDGAEALTEEDSEEMNTDGLQVEEIISGMSLEDKVAQMFIVLPEQLTGAAQVTAAGEMTQEAFSEIPVGGLIYMGPNLLSGQQIKEMLAATQKISIERTGLPAFICVDEEGGTVSRINGKGIVDEEFIGDMSAVGAGGSTEEAYEVGDRIGTYLSDLGFNVDFAPCADVLTNPENTVVSRRSFGEDPALVSDMCLAVMKGLHVHGVLTSYKHFPGHGATAGDTHAGLAYTNKTLEEMEQNELLPFISGAENGTDMIMVGHISAPELVGDDTPASMSKAIITDILREQIGYDGLIITDAMNMGAIVQNYPGADAAITSIKAGTDLILMPDNLNTVYYGILQAVREGEIAEDRIDESLRRIISAKLKIEQNRIEKK